MHFYKAIYRLQNALCVEFRDLFTTIRDDNYFDFDDLVGRFSTQ